MKKKYLLNHLKPGGRTLSVLVTLLVTAMTLIPQSVCGQATDYELTVAGVQVTSDNAANITGQYLSEGTAVFDASSNTLTLSNVKIGYGGVQSGLENLTIVFNGTNIIESYIGANAAVAGSHNLTLQSGSAGSTMYLDNTVGTSIIDGFDNISMDGLYVSSNDTPFAYDETAKQFKGVQISGVILQTATITSIPHYSLWVGNTQLNDENKDDVFPNDQSLAGKVSFDNSSNTLSLQNVDLPYNVFSALNNLTIDVSGNCKVGSGDSATAVRNVHSSSTLTLKSTGTGNQLSFNNDRPIRDFSSITLTGLYWDDDYTYGPDTFEDWDSEKQENVELVGMHLLKNDGSEAAGAIATSAIPYQLKVAGTKVTSENAADVLGNGTVSFNVDNNTLTLNNLDVTSYEVGIQSGLSSLTIHFKGSNSLVSITSSNEDATLTFSGENDAQGSKPVLEFAQSDGYPWSGFSGNPTFEGKLAYFTFDGIGSIKNVPTPYMYVSDGMLVIEVDDPSIESCDYYYSIDYVNGDDVAEKQYDVDNTESISGPCVITAHAVYTDEFNNTVESDNVEGILFGLTNTEVTVKVGQSVDIPTLVPVVDGSEDFTVEFSGYDDAMEKATIGNGKITGVSVGDNEPAIFSCTLSSENDPSFYILNNDWMLDDLSVYVENPIAYGLSVNGISVNEVNRTNVLDTQGGEPTVQFDGDHTLILNNATEISGIELTGTMANLTVHLKGTNTMYGSYIVNGNGQLEAISEVTFTTNVLEPGTLKLTYAGSSVLPEKWEAGVFSNVNVAYENNLNAELGNEVTGAQLITIKALLGTIVDEIENKQVDVVGDLQAQGGSIPTTGVVLDNVLYTLSADGDGITVTDASGNAIPAVDQTVGITTTMTEEDVNAIAGRLADETLVPGTSEFATLFKGMTFLLPAGTGNIIINVRTNESGKLAVKIGNQPAVTFDEAKTAFGELVVPFACSVPTYVLLYNQRAATESREMDSHRAPGRKETATVEIKGLSVSASSVVAVPEPALSPVMLDKSAVAKEAGEHFIKVNNPNVAGVDADAFESVKSDAELTYIDLTMTGIKGITVDRSTDAFKDVPAKAFIYLPAGNKVKAGTKNVIIGSVCENMEMADDAPYFEMAQDFTARNVKQNRDYSDFVDKNCTVYLPFAIDEETAATLGTFYELKGYDGTTVVMESVKETKANTPYMFKPKAADTKVAAKMVKVEATPAAAPVAGSIKFVGTYKQKDIVSDASTQYYCFMADGAEAGKFVHVITTPVTMNPYRAYMVVEGAAARELDLVIDGVSTGIKNMKVGTDDNVYYDLQGRRVLYPTKGLYIVNGHKVIIK